MDENLTASRVVHFKCFPFVRGIHAADEGGQSLEWIRAARCSFLAYEARTDFRVAARSNQTGFAAFMSSAETSGPQCRPFETW